MRRTNQGGSVLGFILVAGAIALILIGGLYVVKWQSQQRQQATPQSTPIPTTSPDNGSSASKTPTTTSNQPSDSAPKTTPKPSSSSSATGTATVDALPHTGSSETVGALLVVGLLSWSAVAYARSRRVVLSF